MKYEFFGVVVKALGQSGQVRALARTVGGVRDLYFEPRLFFEPDGNVFVDSLPDALRVGGIPVTFDAEPNPSPRGRDRQWVKHGDVDRKPKLRMDGYVILDGSALDQPSAPGREGLVNGLKVYLRTEQARLKGPYTASDGELVPEDGLWEWPDRAWNLESHFSAEDGSYEVLQEPLDTGAGVPIDTANPRELTDWFLKEAQELPALKETIVQLHRKGEQVLKRRFAELADTARRRLFEARWARVEKIFAALEFGESQLDELTKAPAFADLWEHAIELRRAELDRDAAKLIADRKVEIRELTSKKTEVEQQVKQLDGQVRKLKKDEKLIRARCAEGVERQRALETHIGTHQQRLLSDIAALAPLLALRSGAPSPDEFLAAPVLARSGPAEAESAPGLDLITTTIEVCRLTLVRDPFAARRVAAVRGWRMYVLQAEPHWLCFDDAWKAGLRAIFTEAAGCEAQFLVHLQDLDRSPPDLWLRPVLDLASGLRDAVIVGHRGWPTRLRITGSLSPGAPHHGLGSWLLSHFAAPEPMEDSTTSPSVQTRRVGGLSRFIDLEKDDLAKRLTAELARQADASIDDVEHLERRAHDRATEVRLTWPLTFQR